MENYTGTKKFKIKYPDTFGLRPMVALCNVIKPYLSGEDPKLSEVRVKIREPKKYNLIRRKRDGQPNVFEIRYDGSEVPDALEIIEKMGGGGANEVEISLKTTEMKRHSARKLSNMIFSEIETDVIDRYCAHKRAIKK